MKRRRAELALSGSRMSMTLLSSGEVEQMVLEELDKDPIKAPWRAEYPTAHCSQQRGAPCTVSPTH